MFRSLLLSLVLAVVLLFMLMSLPMALSEAQTSPASAGPAPEGDEAYVAPAPVLAPAMGMPAQYSRSSEMIRRPLWPAQAAQQWPPPEPFG